MKKILTVILIIFFIILLLISGFGLYRLKGKNSLNKHADTVSEMVNMELAENLNRAMEESNEEKSSVLEAGQVMYQNKIYEYNDNLMTFLLIGVDSRQSIQKEKIPGKGGQADTIILAVLDQEKQTLKMINISRDTMINVQLYDTDGLYSGEERLQLALQYAYGEGKEKSCELMEQAVSHLFYGIPIHGYGAMDIKAVSELNDAVGGVTLTVIEDLSRFSKDLALGNTVTLTGRQALHYVQERDVESEELGANNLRIARQKQFLLEFFRQVKAKTSKDIMLPLSLYETVSKHMITSITSDQVAYLSTIALGSRFEEQDLISVPGSISKTGTYEEYIIDEKGLYDLIIEVFYKEVLLPD